MPFEFLNPYNFVRTPSRDEILTDPFLGDHDPVNPRYQENHSRYWQGRYTGTIVVRLRSQTPLFITDPASKTAVAQDHFSYGSLDWIPATSLKGMISSAYETITNSRFRVFSKKQQEKRLGFRLPADKSSANLIPGLVHNSSDAHDPAPFQLELMQAAWLPIDDRRKGDVKSYPYLYHGITLEAYRHSRGSSTFRVWSAAQIPGLGTFTPISSNLHQENSPDSTLIVDGYVVISGHTIRSKHDERVFFRAPGGEPKIVPLSQSVVEAYQDLIADYQKAHLDGASPPNGMGVVLGSHIVDKDRLRLRDGDFVYARTNGTTVEAIYPVQISRELQDASPWDCLDPLLRPASTKDEMSPGERLFGWVPQQEKSSGSWKGKIRISRADYHPNNKDHSSPLDHFEPLALAILGGPKPSQSRFYLGNPDGSPQPDGRKKEDAVSTKGKRLRGRKVYLHHQWIGKIADKTVKDAYWNGLHSNDKEYCRYGGRTDRQNRSITSWIRPHSDFDFTISVENLSREELGALLSLLELTDSQCFFRLGYGKPLGLGSVSLRKVSAELYSNEEFAARYRSFAVEHRPLSDSAQHTMVQAYQKRLVAAFGKLPPETPDLGPDLDKYAKFKAFDICDDNGKAALKKLAELWQSGLENQIKELPVDQMPQYQDLLELDEQNLFRTIQSDYAAQLAVAAKTLKTDYGWSKLPFIEDLLISMKGYRGKTATATPVCYPRNSQDRGEEGFTWFVDNEKTNRNSSLDGRRASLPLMGNTLQATRRGGNAMSENNQGIFLLYLETGGNQAYIFSTNKLRDVVGASEQIYRIGTSTVESAARELGARRGISYSQFFGSEPIESKTGPYIECVISTSGKAVLLVTGLNLAREFISEWSRLVTVEAPGVEAIATFSTKPIDMTAGLGLNTPGSLTAAYRDAMARHTQCRADRPAPASRFQRIPIVAACSVSGRPASVVDSKGQTLSHINSLQRQVLQEQPFRSRMEHLFPAGMEGCVNTNLDKLEEKDWIAIIHADGNGLGQLFINFADRVNIICGGRATGRDYANHYRDFSTALDQISSKSFKETTTAIFAGTPGTDIVPIVVGGDDLTVVIDGTQGLAFAKTYMEKFCQYTAGDQRLNVILHAADSTRGIERMSRLGMCGGVAIIKPHFPFSDGYRLAESLVESAKAVKSDIGFDAIALDFHILYDSVVTRLDDIRNKLALGGAPGEEAKKRPVQLTAKPYLINSGAAKDPDKAHLWQTAHNFTTFLAAVAAINSGSMPNSQAHSVRASLFSEDPATQQVQWQYLLNTYSSFRSQWCHAIPDGRLYTTEHRQNSEKGQSFTYFLDALEAAKFVNGCENRQADKEEAEQ